MVGIQNCTRTNRTSRMDKILLSFGKCPSVRKSFKRILTLICLSFDFRQLDKKGYKKQFSQRDTFATHIFLTDVHLKFQFRIYMEEIGKLEYNCF